MKPLVGVVAAIAWVSFGVDAFPSGQNTASSMELDNLTWPFDDYPQVLKARQDEVALRILPLGASIMEGWGSTHNSGLRKHLRMALRYDGYDVNMVGTGQHGTDMKDNDHEATAGALITGARRDLERSLPYKPNIVIINVGTNNANGNNDVNRAEDLMGEIVDRIWDADDMRDTCVILSTLLPTSHKEGTINRISINQQYRNLVSNRSKGGKCIHLADMEPSGEGSDFLGLRQPVWAPNENPVIHPNDEGHRRMAYIFYAAIHRALAARQVKSAATMDETGEQNCDKEAGNGEFVANTQRGSGQGDGTYTHFSEEVQNSLEIKSNWDRDQWRFARLFNSRYDDILGWYEFAKNDHRFGVWKNSADGKGNFRRIGDVRGNIYCIPRGLHFEDVDGDGLDDILCVAPNGDVSYARNNGDGNGDKPPSFEFQGKIKNSEGKQEQVRLADIDGDGRVDYGIVEDNGHVRFWRNGGTGKKPEFWQPLGIRADMATPFPRKEGIRFEDINGDGRDDWLYVHTNGRTWTYTNTRSCKKGREGDGLNVAWRQGHFRGSSNAWTHNGMDHLQEGIWRGAVFRDRIFFARIFGTQPAFGNLGVKDYVLLVPDRRRLADEYDPANPFTPGLEDALTFTMRVFKNRGSGGSKLEADGNKYCNMHGDQSGREDYVWVWSDGAMDLYPNAGKTHLSGSESFWKPWVPGFWKPPVQVDRKNLHLTDMNGDGYYDIVWIDPSRNNRVRIWINNYGKTKNWAASGTFTEMSNPPGLECNDRNGIGLFDVAVRFADISGNGRSDYLCIRENGLVRGRIQGSDGGWGPMRQIKYPDGKDRANLRWADVNGDGKDDMIWVDKFNGNGFVWYNEGPGSPEELSGSYYRWRKINDHVFDGSYAGSCQHFVDLDGNGRADLHSIQGTWTNTAESWLNPTCGMRDATGDDSEGVVDPKLPEQPGNPIGGPSPGEGDECSREDDNRDWRDKDCSDPLIKDHDELNPNYSRAEVFNGLDGIGAWRSALDYWNCLVGRGRPRESFPDLISDFFNGPSSFHCDIFNDAAGCSGSSLQCHDVSHPAGYWVLNSLQKVYQLHKAWRDAIADTVTFNDPQQVSNAFGMDRMKEEISTAIIIDIALLGFGGFMAPIWNKALQTSARPSLRNGNAGTIKDEVNEAVKGSATLAKDIVASKMKQASERGTDIKVAESMLMIAEGWRDGIEKASEKLFDGSDESVLKLSLLMSDGAMTEKKILTGLDPSEMQKSLKKNLNSQLIPLTWEYTSAQLYPVVITDDAGCNDEPFNYAVWKDDNWITASAYSKRVCHENKSYWLLAPKDYDRSCQPQGTDLDPKCSGFDLPPGYQALENDVWEVSVEDIVMGSVNTWASNGRKNGLGVPNLDSSDIFDSFNDRDIKTPGMFRIPVCEMEEARMNWYKVAKGDGKWTNFPCNK